jgi:hypothetical protein
MNTNSDEIYVRSHVARDLLQSASLFKTDKLVVWEYVSNGLQYINPGTNPVIRVSLDSKNRRIVISDNGRGMDWAGLQNFFVMHGVRWTPKVGHRGSLTQTQENDPHVKETSSAQRPVQSPGRA